MYIPIQEEKERRRHFAALVVLRLFARVAHFPADGRLGEVHQLPPALGQRQALPQAPIVRAVGEGGPRTPQHRHRGVRLERREAAGK